MDQSKSSDEHNHLMCVYKLPTWNTNVGTHFQSNVKQSLREQTNYAHPKGQSIYIPNRKIALTVVPVYSTSGEEKLEAIPQLNH